MANWPLDNTKTQNQRYVPRNLTRSSSYIRRTASNPIKESNPVPVKSNSVVPLQNPVPRVEPISHDNFDQATDSIISQQISVPIYLNNYAGEYEDNKYRKYSLKALGITKKLALGSTLALSLVLAGGFFYFMSWNTNKGIVNAQAASNSVSSGFNLTNKPAFNGQPASTVEPTNNSVNNYSVAASNPKYLIIQKLNINSMINPVNVEGNYLNAPNNIYNVGWWSESSLPGQTGAVVLDGFSNNGTNSGVFGQANKLKPGDSIKVELGNGSKVNYSVIKTQTFGSSSLTMEEAISPYNQNQNSLNIITCSGQTNTCPNSTADTVIFTAQQ